MTKRTKNKAKVNYAERELDKNFEEIEETTIERDRKKRPSRRSPPVVRNENAKKLPEICCNYISTLSKKTIYSKFRLDLLKQVYDLKEEFGLNLSVSPSKALKEAFNLDLNLILSILVHIFQSHLENHENDPEISTRYQALINISGFSELTWERLFNLLTQNCTPKETELKMILCDSLIKGLSLHDDVTSKELLELFITLTTEDIKYLRLDDKLLNDEKFLQTPTYKEFLETVITSEPVLNAYVTVLEKDYGVKESNKLFVQEKNLQFVNELEKIRFCKVPKKGLVKSFMCTGKQIYLSDEFFDSLNKSKPEHFYSTISAITVLLINEGFNYFVASHLNDNICIDRNTRVINILFGNSDMDQSKGQFLLDPDNWNGRADNFKLRLFQS